MRTLAALTLAPALILAPSTLAHAAQDTKPTLQKSAPHIQTIEIHNSDGTAAIPSFRDEHGKPISAETFTKATAAGRTFSMAHASGSNAVVLTLDAPGSSSGLSLQGNAGTLLTNGQLLPAFQLPMVSGGKVDADALHGAPTLVGMFFADCVACIEELPALNAFKAAHPQMHFLAVTFDDAKTAHAFVDKRDFQWPVAHDAKPWLDKLGVHTYPTLLLLDANGHVLASRSGGIPVVTNSPDEHPDAAAVKASQLGWLEDWVGKHKASKGATAL